ncbi:MAG: NUDIX domain-containing protein [Anaerolineales bacterium]|nr:NUDIX domain-containing protein [Anaerolineales bacterium]
MNNGIGRFLGGIGALVWYPPTNQYLLLRRATSKDFAAGIWECVPGRVNQGEGFMEALQREVQEEIGTAVTPAFFIGVTHFYRGSPTPDNELIGVVFACILNNPGRIQMSAEHDTYRWVTAVEAEAFLTATDPSTQWLKRVITRAEALRKQYPAELIIHHHHQGFDLG